MENRGKSTGISGGEMDRSVGRVWGWKGFAVTCTWFILGCRRWWKKEKGGGDTEESVRGKISSREQQLPAASNHKENQPGLCVHWNTHQHCVACNPHVRYSKTVELPLLSP